MPPFVGLSCVNCGNSLERQCLNLFLVEEEICGAIISLVDCSLSLDCHWCDGLVYGAVITPIVDILEPRVEGVGLMQGFVNLVNIHAVADAIFELREGVRESILKLYFMPIDNISSASNMKESSGNGQEESDGDEDEEMDAKGEKEEEAYEGEELEEDMEEETDSDNKEEEEVDGEAARRAEKRRKALFARDAWCTFKAGVLRGNLNNFRGLLDSDDWWLSEGSTDNLLSIGDAVVEILRFIRQN
ncbi:hypothetical protein SUGI_0245460 [Cryptomeria japonica]|nr:hypothetical protein SUGI_0245460 [Cryptomeria japonica]